MEEKDTMSIRTGTLYGIGVGPGDPDLITVKSAKVLSQVDVIFAAASTKNSYSVAVSAVEPHIPKEVSVRKLPFPMTRDQEVMEKAWADNAAVMVRELESGKDVAFLTLGDPMTYSTYGYVLKYVLSSSPHITVKTIPGITSYQAAAARLNTCLVEGEESLLITSGAKGGDLLRRFSGKLDNVVLLKAYKNVNDIVLALEEADLLDSSMGIRKCGLPDEEVITDLKELAERVPDYWTLVVAKRRKK
jgi:precorrin-2/cobalt-factor-2 C20-methyltransferase